MVVCGSERGEGNGGRGGGVGEWTRDRMMIWIALVECWVREVRDGE